MGITWILDGLEVTIVGNIAGILVEPDSGLNLTEGQVGLAGGIYIAGACTGALFFSYLTDRFGRKKLFLITLAVYLIFSFLTAFSWNFWSFVVFRFIAGTGIGGEYSAIYSAVDELIPARFRGQVALAISGSYWIGAMLGSALSILLLNPNIVSQYYGWRIAFWLGAALGLCILLIRRYVPESPRWLLTHGRTEEAEETTEAIEDQVSEQTGRDLPPVGGQPIIVEQRESIGFGLIARAMFQMYPKRTVLGLTLMGSQAFLYNAIFFTYALVLTRFYGIEASTVPYFLLPFAFGNLLGPLAPRTPLRHRGPGPDDRGLLLPLGRADGPDRLPILPGHPERGHADDPVVHRLLLRLGRRQRRLPDRKRGLPDGDKGDGDSRSSTP